MAFETTTTDASSEPSPFVTFDDSPLKYANERIGACGQSGSGKTHFLLSLFEALEEHHNIAPEDAKVYVLDGDGGMAKLVQRGLLPSKYRQSLHYNLGHSWESVNVACEKVLADAPLWREEHGPASAWLLIDNVYKIYRWARDDYSKSVYGMSEVERAKVQRKKALQQNKGNLPTFNRRDDYGNINQMFTSQFWDPIMYSGINVLATFPTYEDWDDTKNGRVLKDFSYSCQKQVVHDLDDIIWFRTPPADPDRHLATYRKRRTASKGFKDVPDLTLHRLLQFFDANRLEDTA